MGRARALFSFGMTSASKSGESIGSEKNSEGSNPSSPFVLSTRQRELSSQVTWYIYGSQRISKRTFEDPYFKRMLKVSGVKYIMGRKSLKN